MFINIARYSFECMTMPSLTVSTDRKAFVRYHRKRKGGDKLPTPFSRVNTRTGGGGQKMPSLRFFADSGKTAARSAAIFSVPAEN